MGGIVSNPLDDAKRQEIQDTVEEVMGVFSKEFAMGYKTALIDKIRAEKEEKHAKGGYEYPSRSSCSARSSPSRSRRSSTR